MKNRSYHLITYSEQEELATRLTHGLAALLCVPAAAMMFVSASESGDFYRIVSTTIFSLSLLLFYLVSMLYHSIRSPAVRYLFRVLDHAGIYVVIAGTYTPFTLVTLREGRGWLLFGIVWGLALAGVVFKVLMTHRLRVIAPIFYLVLGWLVIFDYDSLVQALAPGGFRLLLAGGVIYTVGVAFYALDRIPYNHAIWHLFVIAGSACHFLAVYWYVVPL